MQFKLTAAFALLATAASVLAQGPIIKNYTTTWDAEYDNASGSMLSVACSTGKNGLYTKGYPTFGSLPTFPFIGGSVFVDGYNSTECGSGWEMTYGDNTIFLTAMDSVSQGFNIAKEAMEALGGEAAVQAGVVNITVGAARPQDCGFPAQ